MRHRTLILLGALLACVAAAAPAAASRPAPALQSELDALVASGPPGAILLVRDGNRTTRLASGVSDLETGRAMHPTDHFRTASLTKTYTSTVVLQLVAEGRLRLDDSVERWLPGLVPAGGAITLRDLLHHTSGLFDHENDPRVIQPYLDGDFGFYWEPRQLVEIAVSHPPLFPPGGQLSSYSNTNYVLLGLIVEAATGHTLAAELRGRIFEPLHLRRTSYDPTTPRLPKPYAHGYMDLGGPSLVDVSGISPSLSPASGAIVSSAEDVADFYRALLSGRLLPPSLLGEMKATLAVVGGDIPGQRYGLGLMRFPTSCGIPAWGHNGAVPGYVTYTFSTEDGARQAVLTVSLSAQSFSATTEARFFSLLDSAFCRGAS
jgi:D-alanyl-D-alanine carboxypeptidase